LLLDSGATIYPPRGPRAQDTKTDLTESRVGCTTRSAPP